MNENDPDDRLDDALRAAFAPPPAAVFRALAERTAHPAPVARPRPFWPWLLAAAAALVLAVLWLERPRRGPEGHDGKDLGRLWTAAYEDASARGFTRSCCEPEFDLASACRERFAAVIALADGSSVEVIGCYCGVPAGGGMVLLAKDAGAPCCVYVLPRARDPGVELPAGSPLRLARRELGDLVLYGLGAAPVEPALAQFVLPQQ